MSQESRFSPAILHELIRYEATTGKFFWKERAAKWFSDPGTALLWNTDNAGKEIFKRLSGNDYCCLIFDGTKLLAHRVAWALVKGYWPRHQIDHINGIKFDNRIENLREATAELNSRNRAMSENNTSGYSGIQKRGNKWIAKIGDNHLGSFDELEDAIQARKAFIAQGDDYTIRHGHKQILQNGKKICRHRRNAMAMRLRWLKYSAGDVEGAKAVRR